LPGEPEVELIVSDNCSADDTPGVVQAFVAGGGQCRYIRNDTNIGPDANFLQCFRQAKGKYFWLIGDDDLVVPGGLREVIRLLTGTDYDLIYVKPYAYTSKEELPAVPITTRKLIVYSSCAKYASKISAMFTFISANIINKERLRGVDEGLFEAAIGTKLIQLAWTFAALNHFRSALFVPQTIILSLSDNSGGWGLCKVMGITFNEMARSRIKSKRVVRILENSTLRDFLPYYLFRMKRPDYRLDDESPHEVLSANFKRNPIYWFFDYPIIKMPAALARAWLIGGRFLSRLARLSLAVLPG
jgi:glycosyltransferase involved in cell wall biosynthesis